MRSSLGEVRGSFGEMRGSLGEVWGSLGEMRSSLGEVRGSFWGEGFCALRSFMFRKYTLQKRRAG